VKEYWLDASVALRFVTGEPAEPAKKAREIFKGTEESRWRLLFHPLVVAEIVYVLLRLYKKPREVVASVVEELLTLPGVNVIERRAVMKALERMRKTPLSFTDAFLAERAAVTGIPVVTFDFNLQKTGLAELPLDS